MTRFDYFRCDECKKILDNCECASNQLMFILYACYDTSGHYKAHFCGVECLKKFLEKVKDHQDLPTIEDEGRPIEQETYGDMLNNQEGKKL